MTSKTLTAAEVNFCDALNFPGCRTNFSMPFGYVIRGALDISRLQSALDCIVRNNDNLRSHFVCNDGEYSRAIVPNLSCQIDRVDFSDAGSDVEIEAKVSSTVRDWSNQRIELTEFPQFRCKLIYLRNNRWLLYVQVGHMIFDIYSKSIFIKEFIDAYSSQSTSDQGAKISILDYIETLNMPSGNEMEEKTRIYWEGLLEGFEPATIALNNKPRVDKALGDPLGDVMTGLDYSIHNDINTLSKTHRVGKFSFYLLALSALEHSISGADIMIYGAPQASRQSVEHRETIGMMATEAVLRVDWVAGQSILDTLMLIHKGNMKSRRHATSFFGGLREMILGMSKDGLDPLCYHFNYWPRQQSIFECADLELEEYLVPQPVRNIYTGDLLLQTIEAEFFTSLNFRFTRNIYTQEEVQKIADLYVKILSMIVDNPNQDLQGLLEAAKSNKDERNTIKYVVPNEAINEYAVKQLLD